jgi:hypothetical protein
MWRSPPWIKAGAAVGHGDQHPVDHAAGLDRDLRPLLLRRDRIFDRILHERLQQQRREPRPFHRRLDLEVGAQAILEAHLLDLEVEFQRLHFLRHGHGAGRLVDQSVAQEGRQAGQHGIGPLGLAQQHQSRDRVQRVEQEVRIELVAQHGELRRACLVFEPLELIGLLLQQDVEVDAVVERCPGDQQDGGEQDRREKRMPSGGCRAK